ncbi:MAG: ADP-forming succinate--CoA ligase subunit beta [Magnetococcales bacterium]|nr:ADP-forming succinate--CoA ligase subunit beta [Magnetococcales bacterium]|tara:strand:- start:18139 stop:19314 length:1176 start_codon:yes stop_codon:yes gene_type:complete
MNLHEYQAKQVLEKFGVAVPRGIVASTPAEAEAAAKDLGTAITVVKAQVHSGARGKAGGVILCKSPEEAAEAAKKLIGTQLVTHQTGAEGLPVHKVYVEEGSDIARELYLSITLDREKSCNFIMASTEGGMDIEAVAEETPEKIFTENVDPSVGLWPYQCRNVAFKLGLKGKQVNDFVKLLMNLYKCYEDIDAAMLEINPLVVTGDDEIKVLDCKINIDSNALYRQKEIHEMDDETQQDEREVKAAKFDLNYIALEGDIGCMVNGAGLAMATMDIIKHYGGQPANFLDVGGGATEERVTEAFKIILSDSNVKGILVNIFGGIMKCDIIANGVVAAAKQVDLAVPLVVRLEGTNVQAGKEILANSGLPIITADDLDDAAQKVVAKVAELKAA